MSNKLISRITNKKTLFIAALQSGAARDFAIAKSRRQWKREKSEKVPYKRGSLGPSVIAAAIKDQYGCILTRADRKAYAKKYAGPRLRFFAHQ